MEKIKIIRYNENAELPIRFHETDAGADIITLQDFTLSRNTIVLGLGFGLEVPEGYMVQVIERSSMAAKGITSSMAPIDSGYTGEIHLILNHVIREDESVEFKKGDRVAQLVITKIETPYFEWADTVRDTERGTGGLGSTGK